MAKKISLNVRSEPTFFTILGISCHLRDYRLSYLFNHNLDFSFVKKDDLRISISAKGDVEFSFYGWRDEERMNAFYLIANRSQDALLVPEMKQFDFLLVIEGKFSRIELNALVRAIRSLPGVLTVIDSDITQIKNYDRLLSDVEMHVTNLQRIPKMKYQPK